MGLAYDSLRDQLIGTEERGNRVYEIDQTTGDATQVLFGSYFNINGLAYDREADLIWNLSFNGSLKTYDPSNSYAEESIAYSDPQLTWTGLAWVVPEPSTAILLSFGLVGIAARQRRSN